MGNRRTAAAPACGSGQAAAGKATTTLIAFTRGGRTLGRSRRRSLEVAVAVAGGEVRGAGEERCCAARIIEEQEPAADELGGGGAERGPHPAVEREGVEDRRHAIEAVRAFEAAYRRR